METIRKMIMVFGVVSMAVSFALYVIAAVVKDEKTKKKLRMLALPLFGFALLAVAGILIMGVVEMAGGR